MRWMTAILRLTHPDPGSKPVNEGRSLSRRSGAILVLLALVVVFVLGAVAGAALAPLSSDGTHDDSSTGTVSEIPGEDSAEAGFARDMMVHHAQAVQMAEIVQRRSESQDIRILAADILLSQQEQIGQMRGWFAVWGLPPAGSEPHMAWMGHPTEGRMPGMASPEEINELQQGSPEEMDLLFLRLMIPHHEAALPMAKAVLERADRPEVEQFATAVAVSQQEEIRSMQESLVRRGIPVESSPPVPVEALPTEEEPHHGTQPESHHDSHSAQEEAQADAQEITASIAHGATQGATAFLVGLVAFVALVWLPTGRVVGYGQDAVGTFLPWIWGLFGLLLVASAAELSLYAVRASGESFGPGLLGQALFETRVGRVMLARLGLGVLMVVAVIWAVRSRRPVHWLYASGIGGVLLATLTLTSHAAAEGGILPFVADWLHVVAASLWMGGLLGFPFALLGPLRAMPANQRTKLRRRAVRRFSRMATYAVMALIITGVYASLLHVPSVEGLLGTSYGYALLIKLGLAALLFAAGGANLVLEGRGPFGRIVGAELILAICVFVATGFLTTLTPADAEQQTVEDNAVPATSASRSP